MIADARDLAWIEADVKFWELSSVCRAEPQLMERLADKPEWAAFLEWSRRMDEIVDEQDRGKLDAEVPDDARLHVLNASHTTYFVSGGYLCSQSFSPSDRRLSAAEAFNLYGGRSLEDAREYGLVEVPTDEASSSR
jgi:hypothetical protein